MGTDPTRPPCDSRPTAHHWRPDRPLTPYNTFNSNGLMLLPFNPKQTPDADAAMAALPEPSPIAPMPAGAVMLLPTLTLDMHPSFQKEFEYA